MTDYNVLMGVLSTYMVVIIAVAVLMLVSLWKVFVKAGQPGWKCLIPIYNAYIEFVIAWEGRFFWYMIGVSVVTGFITGLTGIAFIGTLGSLIGLLFNIALSVKMAHAFDRGTGFAVGLILLPFIFWPILAFSKEIKYIGAC